jgi:hypothetical protein
MDNGLIQQQQQQQQSEEQKSIWSWNNWE